MQGIDYLRNKLNIYRRKALSNQEVYDMKDDYVSPGITV